MNYEEKYKQALEMAKEELRVCGLQDCDAARQIFRFFPELKSEEEKVRKALIELVKYAKGNCLELLHKPFNVVSMDAMLAWLEKQAEQKQTWKPNAAQLIVIKDLIEDENTSKVNKVILRGMFDEFKQFTNTHKREIDDAYLQGICDAKHEIEKRGEQTQFDYEHAYIPQKDFSPIEPKFKVSDWLQYRYAEPFLVEEITEQGYCNGNSCLPFEWEDEIHLWTIQDAKDGDVLVASDGSIFLFAGVVDCACKYYVALATDNHVKINKEAKGGYWETSRAVHPATKEQRELLFSNMKEAGYEWDADKKELKKIEQKTLEMRGNQVTSEIIKNQKEMPSEFTQLVHAKLWDLIKAGHKMLDADKVIDWLDCNICNAYDYDGNEISTTLKSKFKQYFGLC